MDADGDALRERLRSLFLDELDEHVERLEHGLDQLGSALPSVPDNAVQELFRSAHSLKGAAHSVGVSVVGSTCHDLEETLAGIRDGSIRVDDGILQQLITMIDVVAEAGRQMRSGQESPLPVAASASGEPQGHGPAAGAGGLMSGDRTSSSHEVDDSTPQQATIRLPVRTLDALLDQAAELLSAAHRAERLATAVSTAGARLAEEQQEWRHDRQVLQQALGAFAAPASTVGDAIGRIEARDRGIVAELDRLARSAAASERALRLLAESFAAAAREARMVPFTDATADLVRSMRELSRQMGKEGRLVIEAANVGIDKALVARLHDVLRHLVRNAVDHGLERPDERRGAGKPPEGAITITAALRSGEIEVTVSDDGRGVDFGAVREASTGFGIPMTDGDERALLEALFRPGLSTASRVGPVSGRGVGLDAVRAEVESVGGTVTLTSVAGRGTRVVVTVPLTLSTLRAVLVRSAGELVALPNSAVSGLVRISRADVVHVDGRDIVSLRDQPVPVIRLAHAFGWTGGAPTGPPTRIGTPASARDDEPAIVVEAPDGPVVLVVDELLDEREVVMHALPPRLVGVPAVLGTTTLGDGAVALVLSAAACARIGLERSGGAAPFPRPEPPSQPVVLLVEDTLTTRELERGLLEAAGYSVLVASDGAQAWDLLQHQAVDAVVSDVSMPRMDGVALCRAIRSSSRFAEVPVVLVTSLGGDEDRRRGLDAGADAYLPKLEFGDQELLETLGRLL